MIEKNRKIVSDLKYMISYFIGHMPEAWHKEAWFVDGKKAVSKVASIVRENQRLKKRIKFLEDFIESEENPQPPSQTKTNG